MVGQHIAKRAGLFVEGGPAFDADGFGGGDFHIVDIVAVPDRLEKRIAEAED